MRAADHKEKCRNYERTTISTNNRIYRKYRRDWKGHIDRIPKDLKISTTKYGRTFDPVEGFCLVIYCGIFAENQSTLLGNGTTNVSPWQCNNRGIPGSGVFYVVRP
jgi:hypothetical protein